MTIEEISLFIESSMVTKDDTITKVFYGSKTYYGFFNPSEDYDTLRALNKWRFVPNESSVLFTDEDAKGTTKSYSVILNGSDIKKIELKVIAYAKQVFTYKTIMAAITIKRTTKK